MATADKTNPVYLDLLAISRSSPSATNMMAVTNATADLKSRSGEKMSRVYFDKVAEQDVFGKLAAKAQELQAHS